MKVVDYLDKSLFESNEKLEETYHNELKFAEEFYETVIDELKENELEDITPPEPNVWISNGEMLSEHWTELKKTMIENVNEKEKESADLFLKTRLAVYLDLMNTIWDIKLKIPKSQKELTIE